MAGENDHTRRWEAYGKRRGRMASFSRSQFYRYARNLLWNWALFNYLCFTCQWCHQQRSRERVSHLKTWTSSPLIRNNSRARSRLPLPPHLPWQALRFVHQLQTVKNLTDDISAQLLFHVKKKKNAKWSISLGAHNLSNRNLENSLD